MNTQLSFDDLYKRALSDWPKALDLSELQHAELDLSRYTIKGLGGLSDDIEHKAIDTDLEVIFRELHMSIYSVIHSIAKFSREIKTSSIRPKAVQLVFEKCLKASSLRSDLNWNDEDYKLVESYFSQNKQTNT